MREVRSQLLTREMTRKQFLQLMGAGVIAVFGFGNLLSLLARSGGAHSDKKTDAERHGFGSRKFGG